MTRTKSEWDEFFAKKTGKTQQPLHRDLMTIEILSEDPAAFDFFTISDKEGGEWVRDSEPEDNGNGYFTAQYRRRL